jgi:KDO2-lipid IV(A) lauroyltransferase
VLKRLLRPFAYLPLRLLHAMGSVLGWVIFLASGNYARRMRENLRASGLCADAGACRKLLHQSIAEAGKSVAELPAIWLRPQHRVLQLVRECHGWEYVEAALQQGRGLILLSPHMGCFEMAGVYSGAHLPLTVLYRPPRMQSLEPLMLEGRTKGNVRLATTDMKGVRALARALKHGEVAGILPDQVPGNGEGVWADFFGRPAYTMTLVGRLAETSGATVLLTFAERLPRGRGYRLWYEPLPTALTRDKAQSATALNAAIETLIRKCPAQYLWSYNRYKAPRGVGKPVPGPQS